MSSPLFKSKTYLVTGATSGIGKETAILLAAQGGNVVISGRREAEGEEVVDRITRDGGSAIFIAADMSREEDIKNLVAKTVETYGSLDGAVNNAGIATETNIFHELTAAEFEKMIQVNVVGVFLCMKYQIEAMLPKKSGSIVNLASMAGINGVPQNATYVATKHAVVGLTKSAALDYATSGIRVNAVAPSAILTDILQNAIQSGAFSPERIENLMPMKRLGAPIDIARGIAFLLSNEFTTGTILSVDGGLNAQ